MAISAPSGARAAARTGAADRRGEQQGGGADQVDAEQEGGDMIERADALARRALLLLVLDAPEILREQAARATIRSSGFRQIRVASAV